MKLFKIKNNCPYIFSLILIYIICFNTNYYTMIKLIYNANLGSYFSWIITIHNLYLFYLLLYPIFSRIINAVSSIALSVTSIVLQPIFLIILSANSSSSNTLPSPAYSISDVIL